jgi:hypothetical protein
MKLCSFLLAILLLASFFPDPVKSQTISGRLNTSFYTWDRLDGRLRSADDYSKDTHLRGYQTIRLAVTHGDVSIRTYSQYSYDFNTPMAGDPIGRIYDLHLRWRNIFNMLDLSIGRQPIYSGVGRGTIDGGSLRLNIRDGMYTAHIYAGSLVRPFQSGRIQPWNERHMVGGQIAVRPMRGLYTSLSYMDRHNKRDPYIATRADSLFNPIAVVIDGDSREFQLASADISYMIGTRASLYGRLDYNIDDSQPQRMEFWTRVNITSDLALTGEYIFREPLVPYNSIFRMFEVETNQEIEGGIEYRYKKWLTFAGRVAYVMYDDDNSMRIGVSAESRYGSISFSRTDGYAGEMNSISFMAYYPLAQDRFVLSAGGGFATYTPADFEGDSEWALSAIGGVSHKLSRSFSLDLRGQYLRNRVFDYDTRVFIRVNYWFFENLGIL